MRDYSLESGADSCFSDSRLDQLSWPPHLIEALLGRQIHVDEPTQIWTTHTVLPYNGSGKAAKGRGSLKAVRNSFTKTAPPGHVGPDMNEWGRLKPLDQATVMFLTPTDNLVNVAAPGIGQPPERAP